jgi:hypothetical protein
MRGPRLALRRLRRLRLARRERVRALRWGLVLAAVALTVVGGAAVVPGATAADPSPSADCANGGSGALYVTDTGLVVEESAPAVDLGRFPDDRSVDFGSVRVASAGPATARLENGTGAVTCLAAVNASSHAVTVTADGEGSFVLAGRVDALSFGAPNYDEDDAGVDLAYEAPAAFVVRVPATGLPRGERVEAVTAGGAVLDATTVAANATATFELPAGTREVNLTAGGPAPVCSGCPPPTDPDGDGAYEDVNGNGAASLADVTTLFAGRDDPAVANDPAAFDFNDNGAFTLADVTALFEAVASSPP